MNESVLEAVAESNENFPLKFVAEVASDKYKFTLGGIPFTALKKDKYLKAETCTKPTEFG